ncbi:MAG: CARDB domain-containing protein [Methylophilaceae bacterium]
MKTTPHSIKLIALAFACIFGANTSMAAPTNKSDLAPVVNGFNAGKATPESNELNNKKIHIKTVAKPIGSITSKAKENKQFKALDNKTAVKKRPNQTIGKTFGTSPGRPDLIIMPAYHNTSLPEGQPGQSYCEKAIGGGAAKNIWFYVRNTGDASSAASEVRTMFNTFIGGGTSSVNNQVVPALAAGASQMIKVPVPTNCYPGGFSTSCHFRIIADADYQVEESHELNNHIDSKCVNPAG